MEEHHLLEAMEDTGLAPKLLRFWDGRDTDEDLAAHISGIDPISRSVALVREYIPGIPLDVAKCHGVRFSTQHVEDAVDVAHERGYASFDVCDVNIVVTFAAQAFLFDWGPYGHIIRRGAVSTMCPRMNSAVCATMISCMLVACSAKRSRTHVR